MDLNPKGARGLRGKLLSLSIRVNDGRADILVAPAELRPTSAGVEVY
jgi:hypothetical protein